MFIDFLFGFNGLMETALEGTKMIVAMVEPDSWWEQLLCDAGLTQYCR